MFTPPGLLVSFGGVGRSYQYDLLRFHQGNTTTVYFSGRRTHVGGVPNGAEGRLRDFSLALKPALIVSDTARITAESIFRRPKRSRKVGPSTGLPCFAVAPVLAGTAWSYGVEGEGLARLASRVDLWCTE